MAFDLAIGNTWFEKVNQMASYKSGEGESQIDLLMWRKSQMKEMENGKVINGV